MALLALCGCDPRSSPEGGSSEPQLFDYCRSPIAGTADNFGCIGRSRVNSYLWGIPREAQTDGFVDSGGKFTCWYRRNVPWNGTLPSTPNDYLRYFCSVDDTIQLNRYPVAGQLLKAKINERAANEYGKFWAGQLAASIGQGLCPIAFGTIVGGIACNNAWTYLRQFWLLRERNNNVTEGILPALKDSRSQTAPDLRVSNAETMKFGSMNILGEVLEDVMKGKDSDEYATMISKYECLPVNELRECKNYIASGGIIHTNHTESSRQTNGNFTIDWACAVAGKGKVKLVVHVRQDGRDLVVEPSANPKLVIEATDARGVVLATEEGVVLDKVLQFSQTGRRHLRIAFEYTPRLNMLDPSQNPTYRITQSADIMVRNSLAEGSCIPTTTR